MDNALLSGYLDKKFTQKLLPTLKVYKIISREGLLGSHVAAAKSWSELMVDVVMLQ